MSASRDEARKALEEIIVQVQAAARGGQPRTAVQLAQQVAGRARAQGFLQVLLEANFHIMVSGRALVDLEGAREAAIENIAFLENPERAMAFDTHWDDEDYLWTVGWMTACSYDNLARCTGQAAGYNSEGLHALIDEGIAVCHRTGKAECITCFREYASDVQTAAADLTAAKAHVDRNLAPGVKSDGRRWFSGNQRATLLLLEGRLVQAWKATVTSHADVDDWHSLDAAKREMLARFDAIRALSGERVADLPTAPELHPPEIDEGECPELDWKRSATLAVRHVASHRFDEAIALLKDWDARLLRGGFLSTWFDARLRLIAALVLGAREGATGALIRDVEKRAQRADDRLTLQRLKALQERPYPVSPAALAGPLDRGPWAAPSS